MGVLKAICIWPIFIKIETIKIEENALQAYKVATKHQSIDERLELNS
jgi:hypothetical protein